jgi:NAD-dependent SIR2 family protein deacetylase
MGGQLHSLLGTYLPGQVILASGMRALGISPALAASYVRSGWLEPLGVGAWKVAGRSLAWAEVVHALQTESEQAVRPHGYAALQLLGLAPLGLESPLTRELALSAPTDAHVPAWAMRLLWSGGRALRRYPQAQPLPVRLPNGREAERHLEDTTRVVVEGRELVLPTPERAMLELLDACATAADVQLARQCLTTIPLMRRHLEALLTCWPSYRTRRMLRWLLQDLGHTLAAELRWDRIDLGKGKRQLFGGGHYVPDARLAVPGDLFTTADAWQRVAALLAEADKLLVMTGNGARVDVDDVTYHVPASFQAFYPAYATKGLVYEDFLHREMFNENPRLAWGLFADRLLRARTHGASPLAQMLRVLQPRFRGGVFVRTTNIDGDILRGGVEGRRVMEVMGSLSHSQCMEGCRQAVWEVSPEELQVDQRTGLLQSTPPRCPYCGAPARPNVKLLNDDTTWETARVESQRQHYYDWLAQPGRLLVLELGAGRILSGLRQETLRLSVPVIRINVMDAAVEGDGVGLTTDVRQACERLFAAALPSHVIDCAGKA